LTDIILMRFAKVDRQQSVNLGETEQIKKLPLKNIQDIHWSVRKAWKWGLTARGTGPPVGAQIFQVTLYNIVLCPRSPMTRAPLEKSHVYYSPAGWYTISAL
jgi:hypothetical protein